MTRLEQAQKYYNQAVKIIRKNVGLDQKLESLEEGKPIKNIPLKNVADKSFENREDLYEVENLLQKSFELFPDFRNCYNLANAKIEIALWDQKENCGKIDPERIAEASFLYKLAVEMGGNAKEIKLMIPSFSMKRHKEKLKMLELLCLMK